MATFDRLVSDPKSGALSAYKGILSKGGIKKIDNLPAAFLDAVEDPQVRAKLAGGVARAAAGDPA